MDNLIPAYYLTMDAMLQLVIENSHMVDNLQFVILALEGIVLTILVVFFVWLVTVEMLWARHNLYSMFIVIPMSFIRTLATMPINLDEEEEEAATTPNNQDVSTVANLHGNVNIAPQQRAQYAGMHLGTQDFMTVPDVAISPCYGLMKSAAHLHSVALHDKSPQIDSCVAIMVLLIHCGPMVKQEEDEYLKKVNNQSQGNMKLSIKMVADDPKIKPRRGAVGKLIDTLHFWKPKCNIMSGGKKKLRMSYGVAVYLTAPFVLWGLVIIVCSALSFKQLAGVDGPIATFNTVNFVTVRLQRVWFYVQEICYDENPTVKDHDREQLHARYESLRKEYVSMLQGHEVGW